MYQPYKLISSVKNGIYWPSSLLPEDSHVSGLSMINFFRHLLGLEAGSTAGSFGVGSARLTFLLVPNRLLRCDQVMVMEVSIESGRTRHGIADSMIAAGSFGVSRD